MGASIFRENGSPKFRKDGSAPYIDICITSLLFVGAGVVLVSGDLIEIESVATSTHIRVYTEKNIRIIDPQRPSVCSSVCSPSECLHAARRPSLAFIDVAT